MTSRRPRSRGWALAFFGALAAAHCAGEPPGAPPQAVSEAFERAARVEAQAADAAGRMAVAGQDGWWFFVPELRHVSQGPFWGPEAARTSRAERAELADPLPAILDFRDQLAARGVALLLVPVPPKCIVYPEKLTPVVPLDTSGRPPRLDRHHQRFYALLREQGVDVLDLTDTFLAARTREREPLYCRQDTHWSGTGLVVAARAIAHWVKARPWSWVTAPRVLDARWETVSIAGDLVRTAAVDASPAEPVRIRRIGTAQDGTLTPLAPDPTSPVVLLSDSHGLVFHAGGDMHARGAGLADQLAYELGFPVDLVAVRGSGATAARLNLLRRAQRDPGYWRGKHLVVWCFGAREFTEGDGWRKLPIGG